MTQQIAQAFRRSLHQMSRPFQSLASKSVDRSRDGEAPTGGAVRTENGGRYPSASLVYLFRRYRKSLTPDSL